jgi:hypothetical protein
LTPLPRDTTAGQPSSTRPASPSPRASDICVAYAAARLPYGWARHSGGRLVERVRAGATSRAGRMQLAEWDRRRD